MIRKLLSFLIFGVWLAHANSTHGAVTGEIVGQGGQKFPIAVSPLKILSAAPSDAARLSTGIADAMVHDLDLSGWFKVLDRSAYIEDAQKTGITLGAFDFKDWSTIGAEGLVKGGFSVQGDEITVELRLFDVYQNKERIGKRYTGRVRDFRRIAHKFVDEIINQFTGIPGVFNTRIAYVSNGGGRFKEIYVSHLDGSEKFQVTDNHTINLSPSWSGDGKSILYSSFKDRNQTLYLFELFSGKEVKFTPRGSAKYLSGKLSPDGQTVVATLESAGNSNLYLLSRSGDVIRRLTEDAGIEVSPSWSPDGKQIVFVSDRSGSPQLYILDLSSGNTRRLTYSGSYNTSPDWSPKGDRIVYTGRVGNRFAIFSISVDGGEPRKLTAESADSEDPTWSPDGRFVAFSSNRAGKYHLYVMQASGENQRRLTGSGGDDTKPSWSPRLD
ncbi:MAG TPA: Tol-Pal system beta propeller repeat protein TolB [Candidatus Limnocylindrales bacterium]|nr:Tol-Pal system beta propeller repeat protein TolB [Candidatus Limnocylindrales bacterium]